MPHPPVTLYRDPTQMRRVARLGLALVGAMILGMLALHFTRTPEQVARAVARQPGWMPAWFIPWGVVAVVAVLGALSWLLITRATTSTRPFVTISADGIAMATDGFFGRPAPAPYVIPWEDVTAVRRPPMFALRPIYVELVSDHRARHERRLGLDKGAARRAAFLGPVHGLGPARTPTLTLMPAMLGVTGEELEAAIERHREAARLQRGEGSRVTAG